MTEKCQICKQEIGSNPSATLTLKGCEGINLASQNRGDDLLVQVGQQIHISCRKDYTNKHLIAKDLRKSCNIVEPSCPPHALRSKEPTFKFSEHCIFCGRLAKFDAKRRGYDVFPIRTIEFENEVRNVCKSRDDKWACTVLTRIEIAGSDLHAADAVYHQSCSVNFRTNKQIPLKYLTGGCEDESKKIRLGRPEDKVRSAAFEMVVQFVEEHDEDQMTVCELTEKMKEFLPDSTIKPYTTRYMKTSLLEYFQDRIVIAEIEGKADVITFTKTANMLLHEFYKSPRNTNSEEEKLRLIKTAAKLIRVDIKNIGSSNKDLYPDPTNQMHSTEENLNYLPDSLQLLLGVISNNAPEVKLASLGQAIMQMTRPRDLLAPLQIGLAVQMHHHFSSRFVVDSLHKQGFCSSYSEVQMFERSASVHQGTDIIGIEPGSSIQYVADNVDHNIRTLDGLGTFHGMGIIAAVTPGTTRTNPVPRINVTAKDISDISKIQIHNHISKTDISRMKYKIISNTSAFDDPTADFDLLWKISILLKNPRPAWSGMMQTIQQGDHPGKSSIHFLPMIDLNPSDPTCILSTLNYVCSHAARYNVTPILTFDQPLFWKAFLIIQSEPTTSILHSIVLRLGGLHTMMSFLGSIGNIMADSGLSDVLELVYANNAVNHMLTGKAIARATRGHLLVVAALNTMLASQALNAPLPSFSTPGIQNDDLGEETEQAEEESSLHEKVPTNASSVPDMPCHLSENNTCMMKPSISDQTDQITCIELDEAEELYDKLMSHPQSVDETNIHDAMGRINTKLQALMSTLKDKRTAKLWLQYMDTVDILCMFIKGERTGDWKLHLAAISRMMPYFAASGHNLYTKSAAIYIDQMSQLSVNHPDIYAQFCSGYHVIRRSDNFWAGLSSDLIIEQVLMRSIKTSGGLTRGRGMTETQRSVWLLSMPACAKMNEAMQDFTGVSYSTSEQHKDMSSARQLRDSNDTLVILHYFLEHSPFSDDPCLRNIASGVTAGHNVNVDNSNQIGLNILQDMDSKQVSEYTFKKKNQAITLGIKHQIKVGDDVVQVDPQLLFQRLVTAGERCGELELLFKYELCSFPSALFEAHGLMRLATKSQLADSIWKQTQMEGSKPNGDVHYVLDGGSLLHRVPWTSGSTYREICHQYLTYITRYGYVTAVFDGYMDGPSTKDVTHQRRSSKQRKGTIVNFTLDMKVTMKKEEFLSNDINKHRFVIMLADMLQSEGHETMQAAGDADSLIVMTALESAEKKTTMLLGEDTDLLVLLCHHAHEDHDVYFTSFANQQPTKKLKFWDIRATRQALGPVVCKHLLFMHAFLGCDTTSRIYGVGKGVMLSKFQQLHSPLLAHAEVFYSGESSSEDVKSAGEMVLVQLLSSKHRGNLDKLRFQTFCEKVCRSTVSVQLKSLPPTSSALGYHSLRVYLQVQLWKGNNGLHSESWGWTTVHGVMVANETDMAPAPTSLLEAIHCNCKTDCSSMRCKCRKHGLECSAGCGECRGVSCMNAIVPITNDHDDAIDNE